MGSLTDEEADFLEETAKQLEDPNASESIDADTLSQLGELAERNRRNEESDALQSAERTLREARRSLAGTSTPPAADGEQQDGGPGGEEFAQGESGEAGGSGSGDAAAPEAGSTGTGASSRSAGDLAVADEKTDDFQRSDDASASVMGDLDGRISGESEVMQTIVRNLPEATSSLLRDEEILVDYVRSVEDTISQEEVPIGLRNYIKDYFLRIGIKGEE
jgi:hypothetical protein